jgi:pilus assembly protein CpaC
MSTRSQEGLVFPKWAMLLAAGVLSLPILAGSPRSASAQALGPQPVVHRVEGANGRLELIVNSSRLLKLDQKIPRVQVNNPELVELTPLSPTEVQASAKKTGVTQINLWDESGQIHTLDVIIYGDTRELEMVLRSLYPNASIKVMPLANAAVVSGYLDDVNQMNRIIEIAGEYYPRIINNMTIGGVQQVLLHVKVMEVSRTKLRNLGIDFANLSPTTFAASGVSGLLGSVTGPLTGSLSPTSITGNTLTSGITTAGKPNLSFGVVNQGNAFFMFLNALRQNNLAKIMAQPDLVTVSGRPAYFNVGGEFPIQVPQSLGTISIQYKRYGTQIDFVPIVLGNGAIRLEVKPRVSEIDTSLGVIINGTNVPALKTREVDTGVEMRPGETLAIAGLIQHRTEAAFTGIPWVSELPWIGTFFRQVHEETNEIELLILVTPELVEAMDPRDVPPCGPGLSTTSPNDVQLFLRGHIEVPKCCANGNCGSCVACREKSGQPLPNGQLQNGQPGNPVAPQYEQVPAGQPMAPPANVDPANSGLNRMRPLPPSARAPAGNPLASSRVLTPSSTDRSNQGSMAGGPPSRSIRNRTDDRSSQPQAMRSNQPPAFIGPLGYDNTNGPQRGS